MSDDVNGANLTDDERAYLRAAAAVLVTIADANDVAPGLNNKSIAALLGWDRARARLVARGLGRTGLMASSAHLRELVRMTTEAR